MSRNRWTILVAVLFSALGAGLIADSTRAFSSTWDETAHITAGLQLIQDGEYNYELVHTPVARLAAAVGPWLAGAEFVRVRSYIETANKVMASGPGYRTNLVLGRLGIIPFFLVTCACVFLWARRAVGPEEAAVAVALFSLTPPVLAHSGLATTDAAAMASFAALLTAIPWWLERPRVWQRVVVLGLVGGLALSSKISVLPFAIVSTALLLLARRLAPRDSLAASTDNPLRSYRLPAACGAVIALLVLGATYRFSSGSLLGFWSPLPEFVMSALLVLRHSMTEFPAYLMGETYLGGKFLFFPTALAVKTPIPLLVLALAGMAVSVRAWLRTRSAFWLEATIATLIPLLIASSSNINFGIRHILPVFPALAILGAIGLCSLWRVGGAGPRALAVALMFWIGLGTLRVHPDYLTYFNEMARGEPGDILVESDLDWGQDLERLADTVAARRIEHLNVAYYGFGNRLEQVIPDARRLERGAPRPVGWFAISETIYRRGWTILENEKYRIEPTTFQWLRRSDLVTRVGGMRLYHVTDTTDAASSSNTRHVQP